MGLSPGTLSEPGEDRETFIDTLTDTWNKQELCDWLEEHGLPVDGGKPVLKPVLVWRVKKVIELNDWKKQDLRDWLGEREVRHNGNKVALVARVTRMEELNVYRKKQDLLAWLRQRGLPMNGDKDALVSRVARAEQYALFIF